MTISDLDSASDCWCRSIGALIVRDFESCRALQRAQADQVVRGGRKEKLPVDPRTTAMVELAQAPNGFHPAKDFLRCVCELAD